MNQQSIKVLLGHTDIRTTEIYVHANKDRATASKNPLEALLASPAATSAEVVIPFSRERKQA